MHRSAVINHMAIFKKAYGSDDLTYTITNQTNAMRPGYRWNRDLDAEIDGIQVHILLGYGEICWFAQFGKQNCHIHTFL